MPDVIEENKSEYGSEENSAGGNSLGELESTPGQDYVEGRSPDAF